MKKSNAIGSRVSSKLFSYKNKQFTADMAEVSCDGVDVLDQLWHDSSDKGFVMVSDKTGKEIDFVLHLTDREADGDIRFWVFTPAAHVVSYNKELTGVKVVIFND